MAISISDPFSSQTFVPPSVPDSIQGPAGDATDTVRLSEEAQIRLLAQQGESPAEIALDLGVAAMTVATYLDATPLLTPPVLEPPDRPSPIASIQAMG